MSANVFETHEGSNAVHRKNQTRGSDDAIESEDDLDHLMDEFEMTDSEDDEAREGAAGNAEAGEEKLFLSSSEDEFDADGIPIEDDYGEDYDFRDALRSAGNFRVKNKTKKTGGTKSYWKRKMMRSTNRELDPEVRQNLSQANEAFVRNDFQVALDLYLAVIKKDPKNFSAYKTLGEIYKQQGSLTRCCNYWLLAANIHPWDSQFWANVAELSSQLGHTDQAIYCYTRAISSDTTKSSRYILERAILYREKKQYGRALEGFQKVRQLYPTDSNIVKNLASVYVEQKRINDAINLYMKILDYNINPSGGKGSGRSASFSNDDEESSLGTQKQPKFGWAELNILLELYIQQHSWRNGIKVTKIVSRWIQDRSNEKWWDEIDDDSEFDEKRRFEVLEGLKDEKVKEESRSKFYDLPIDIRYKIGHLRLGLLHKEEAMKHFEVLLEEKDDISDLYFETGKILEEHGYYDDALQFLLKTLSNDDFESSTDLVVLLGKCFLETGDYVQAKQAYDTLLTEDKENLDFKISLAEAEFHLNNTERARTLLIEVTEAREKESKTKGEAGEDDMEVDAEEDFIKPYDASLIRTEKLAPKSKKLTEHEKFEVENNAKKKVLEKYRSMKRLEESINSQSGEENRVAIKTWNQLADQLLEIFVRVKSFFPRDKNRQFKGIILYRRKKDLGIEERLARLFNIYQGIGGDEDSNENYSRQFLTSKVEYRGISYDEWFKIFTQNAILLMKYDNDYESANHVIDLAMNVSIFIQDKVKESMLRLIKLIIGLRRTDTGIITTFIRNFLILNQFSPFIYKFFVCCFSSGIISWETFTNYNHQKFFLRQLKAFDSILLGKKLIGMATITSDVKDIHFKKDHIDLLYVYANLLGGSRSYVSSIVYLNRAYKTYNQDPMICLVIGLSHIHRSMQRLSTNRHLQLLQGISYLLEYKEVRQKDATDYELQEIEYNFGRLFHMIGLTSLAVGFYEKVLTYHGKLEEDYDLSVDAAYNLTLIYNTNGNSWIARDLTVKYLTI